MCFKQGFTCDRFQCESTSICRSFSMLHGLLTLIFTGHPKEHSRGSYWTRGEGRCLVGQFGPIPAHGARVSQWIGECRCCAGGEGRPLGRCGQCLRRQMAKVAGDQLCCTSSWSGDSKSWFIIVAHKTSETSTYFKLIVKIMKNRINYETSQVRVGESFMLFASFVVTISSIQCIPSWVSWHVMRLHQGGASSFREPGRKGRRDSGVGQRYLGPLVAGIRVL